MQHNIFFPCPQSPCWAVSAQWKFFKSCFHETGCKTRPATASCPPRQTSSLEKQLRATTAESPKSLHRLSMRHSSRNFTCIQWFVSSEIKSLQAKGGFHPPLRPSLCHALQCVAKQKKHVFCGSCRAVCGVPCGAVL